MDGTANVNIEREDLTYRLAQLLVPLHIFGKFAWIRSIVVLPAQ